jgi:hypothetical protein
MFNRLTFPARNTPFPSYLCLVKYALHPFSLKSLIYIEKSENNL